MFKRAIRQCVFPRRLSTTNTPPTATNTKPSDSASKNDRKHDDHHHHQEYKPIVGPGRDPARIATAYESTAGLERLEYLSHMSGRPLYLNEPLRVDHYGTLQKPVEVPSLEEERIVGCTGFPKYSHAPMWMRLKGVMRCVECGQAFRIKRVD